MTGLKPPSDDDMQLHRVAHLRLYRPSGRAELVLRDDIIAGLRTQGVTSGFYTGKEANRVVQTIYEHGREAFDQAMQACGSRDLVEFLLEQLAIWTEAGQLLNNAKLHVAEAEFVQKHLADARLASMFAIEAMVVAAPPQSPPSEHAMGWLNIGFAAAEIMISLAMYSTSAHAVLPDHTEVTVDLETPSNYLDMKFAEPYRSRWQQMQQRRLLARQDSMHLLEPGPTDQVLDRLDPVFKSAFGWSLREAYGVIGMMMKSYKNTHEGFDVAFVRQSTVYQAVAQNTSMSVGDVQAILDAVTLKPGTLSATPRELWRPGQTSRSLRRPVLLLPHPTVGLHLCWKNPVVQASGVFLLQEMCFRKLPPEWTVAATTTAVDAISQDLDAKWETTVHERMLAHGLVGDLNVLKVLSGDGSHFRLDQEEGPGEIDGLYWNDQLGEVYVLEFKRTQPTFNPPQFRSDIDKYWKGKKAYCVKHQAKVRWVQDHLADVVEHLKAKCLSGAPPDAASITRVKGCIVTKYESFVQVLDTPYPVLSLPTVLRHFEETGEWMFSEESPTTP